MSSRYSSCFSFTSPTILSRSTCEKPMIAFSGVRSSCDMLARNSDLCWLAVSSSRYRRWSSSFIRFTFAASAPSSSRFVTSTCPEKSPEAIAASRESIRWIGPITDHERTNPSNSARPIAPAATPMKRFRELAYALAFWAIRSFVFAVVALASSVASWLRSTARLLRVVRRWPSPRGRLDDLAHERREPTARRTDLAKDALVFGRRHEAEAVGERRRRDPRRAR